MSTQQNTPPTINPLLRAAFNQLAMEVLWENPNNIERVFALKKVMGWDADPFPHAGSDPAAAAVGDELHY